MDNNRYRGCFNPVCPFDRHVATKSRADVPKGKAIPNGNRRRIIGK